MALNDTLVVPVEVAAFAVNPQVRDTDDSYVMHRSPATFVTFASRNDSPELPPFAISEPQRDKPERLGAYVTWQLPSGLARGRETDEGIGDFPLVPNRWLVTRRWDGGGVRSWLVESDHVGATGTVSSLDPHAATVTPTLLGRKHELTATAPWREPEERREPFLTALGPGLLAFSVYQPYNTNVFSLHDTLDDVTADARVSYRVIGWYAQEDSDVLRRAGEFRDVMDELEWILPPGNGNPRPSCTRAACSASTGSRTDPSPSRTTRTPTTWSWPSATPPPRRAPSSKPSTAAPGALDTDEARLFKAFTLGTLEQLERCDGGLFTERAAHQSGFGPAPGGFAWRVVDRGTPDPAAALSAVEAARESRAEADIIATLNTKQRELDAEEKEPARRPGAPLPPLVVEQDAQEARLLHRKDRRHALPRPGRIPRPPGRRPHLQSQQPAHPAALVDRPGRPRSTGTPVRGRPGHALDPVLQRVPSNRTRNPPTRSSCCAAPTCTHPWTGTPSCPAVPKNAWSRPSGRSPN